MEERSSKGVGEGTGEVRKGWWKLERQRLSQIGEAERPKTEEEQSRMMVGRRTKCRRD